jgi:DNA repair protein RadC
MNIHSEHRQRVKNRFRNEGLDHFEELHALELLLFYALPRIDTNPIAHDLLNHFGNLRNVLEAPVEQLMGVNGVGEHAAILLSLVRGLSQKYMISGDSAAPLNTLEDCGNYLINRFIGQRNEVVMLLCLDAKRAPLCCRIVSEGSVNTAEISTRKVVEAALAVNATSVILAHNHPSGIAVPSMPDIVTTRRMGAALSAVDIVLEDHFVVADRDYVSLRQSNYYDPEQCRLMV